jgi:hypothetical protein
MTAAAIRPAVLETISYKRCRAIRAAMTPSRHRSEKLRPAESLVIRVVSDDFLREFLAVAFL